MDMRYDMRDGRRLPPRNSRGEFTRRGRGRSRRDRGMNYDMRGDMRGRDYGDYEMDMARGRSRGRNDYGDYDMRGGMDGHYGSHGGRTGGYEPVEFMGYCTGYAGEKQDYGYRNYDMRGRDYGYPMHERHYPPYDYGYPYDDYGDYGETLSEKELEHWCEKLKKKLDDQEKQMFHKDMIAQKAKQFGGQMKGFGEKEVEVVALMLYDDFKKTLGRNPDVYIKLAFDWLNDEDAELKGAEKLAVYHDDVVMGGEDD